MRVSLAPVNRAALLPLLALAACAAPPVQQAERTAARPQFPPLAREAARIVPQPRFAAVDYLIVDKSELDDDGNVLCYVCFADTTFGNT